MFAQELLGDLNVLVRDFVRVQVARLFMQARFGEVGAVERTTDGDFAFIAATKGTDFAADAGAVAARFARLADLAFHGGRDRYFYRSIGLDQPDRLLCSGSARPVASGPAGGLGVGQIKQHSLNFLDGSVLNGEELSDEAIVCGGGGLALRAAFQAET